MTKESITNHWQIQDFPDGGDNFQGRGANLLFRQIFGEFGPVGADLAPPPRSANASWVFKFKEMVWYGFTDLHLYLIENT